MLERVCTATYKDRESARMFLCCLENLDAFVIFQTWGLSGSSERYQEIDSGIDLAVYQCGERVIIHLTVSEWGDERCSATC